MKVTNKVFKENEVEFLLKAKSRTLKSVDLIVVARDNLGWNTARIHINDDINIDLNNNLESIVIDEFGNSDEFGILSLDRSSNKVLELADVCENASTFIINKRIKDVLLVEDTISVFGNEKKVSELSYVQAIAFDLEDGFLVLDKETWFSEMIAIKEGNDLQELIYDDSANWEDSIEDDPTTHYEFNSKIVKL